MKSYYLFFLLFFAIPANAGLFEDMLNQTYIHNVTELPVYQGTPDIKLQSYKHITAWIDIVGFKGVVSENGIEYIKGYPADSAIVQSDAHLNIPKGNKCYSCELDSIKKTITVSQSGSYTIATMQVILKFHETLCAQKSCWLEYYEETGTFQDKELSPLQYPALVPPMVNITEYKNPIEDKISVNVKSLNASIIEMSYGNQTARHVLKIYRVENNTGVATAADTWEFSGTGISRIQNNVIINTNVSTIDYSQLNVTVSNAYESIQADYTKYNITRIEYKPEAIFNPVLIFFVGAVAVFSFSSYSILRRIFK